MTAYYLPNYFYFLSDIRQTHQISTHWLLWREFRRLTRVYGKWAVRDEIG